MGVQNTPQERITDNIQFFDRIVRLFPVSYYAPEVDDAEGAPTEPNAKEETKALPATTQAASLSELRERLQAKVQSMKQPRKENDENPHKRKRKKKEQEGKQDKKPTTKKPKVESEKKEGGKEQKVTVMKQKPDNQKEKPTEKKTAKKEKAEKQSVEKQPEGNKQKRKNDKITEKAPKTQAAKPAPVAIEKEVPTQAKKKPKKQLGQDLMFSSVTMDTPKEQLENLPGSSKKNAHRALRKVLSFEKHVQDLKQDNPDVAREVVKQASFSAALNRVQGIKVHDDKTRLAKALKRKEKSKLKSQKEWNERNKKVTSQTKQAAQKRNDNVKAKLAERSANRLKKSIKKRGDVRALLASAGS